MSFTELAALATPVHSEFLSDATATYQYRAHDSQSWTTLLGVVEHSQTIENRKTDRGWNRVAITPLYVPSDQFTAPPILHGLVRIIRASKPTDYTITSAIEWRTSRWQLHCERVNPGEISRPNYRR